jgi:phosphoglycerol transferase MdoB-like AlkP superfamily enzyme
MNQGILIKIIRVLALIFSLVFSVLGFLLLWGTDRGTGLYFLLIAAISIAGLLVSDAIKNQNKDNTR